MNKSGHPDFCTVPYDYSNQKWRYCVSLGTVGLPMVPVFAFSELGMSESPSADHVHPGCVELVYALRGSFQFRSGARHYRIPVGTLLAIQPNCYHHCTSFYKGMRFFSLLIRVGRRDAFPGLTSREGNWLCARLRALPNRSLWAGPDFQRILYRVLKLYQSVLPLNVKKLQIRALMLELLLSLVEMAESGRASKPRLTTRDRLDKTIDEMRKYPERDYPVGEMAHACAMSECLFHRLFKSATNESPHQFLLHQRLARALKAIRGTHTPLGQIAATWHFCSADYFARQFRMFYGITPAQVRAGWKPLETS